MKKQLLLTILIAGVLVVSSVGLARISNPSDTSSFLESPVGVSDGGTGLTTIAADRYLYATSTDTIEGVTSSTLRTLVSIADRVLSNLTNTSTARTNLGADAITTAGDYLTRT